MPAIVIVVIEYLPYTLPLLAGFLLLFKNSGNLLKGECVNHRFSVINIALIISIVTLWVGVPWSVIVTYKALANAYAGHRISYYPGFSTSVFWQSYTLILMGIILGILAVLLSNRSLSSEYNSYRRWVIIPTGSLFMIMIGLVIAWGFYVDLNKTIVNPSSTSISHHP
jgi:hypothetical protein